MTERTLQEERVLEQMLLTQRKAMVHLLRKTIPEQMAKDILSVQPINITKEQWDTLPAVLAAWGTHERNCCLGHQLPSEESEG